MSTVAARPDAREIARVVSMQAFRPELLPPAEQFFRSNTQRFRRYGRRARAVCPFHPRAEHQNFSIDLDRGLYKCFVCGASGDMVKFVMERDRVDFREAAKRLGALAQVDNRQAAKLYFERQRQRERIDLAAEKLCQLERSLRLECRGLIHDSDRVLAVPGPWSEAQWRRAQAAYTLRNCFFLPAYTLLSWGRLAERARYALRPAERDKMLAGIRRLGGLRTDAGFWMEVPA